ncbi:MAG TPA: hypothetical protein VH639_10815 [Bryobacteraceae bacterium]
MAAILLRMAGANAFDGDAQAQAPDRELGEVKKSVRGSERDAVIGADGLGQAALLKQALKRQQGRLLLGGFQGFAEQQIPGSVIGDGEGIAVALVTELELYLKVSTPQLIRASARRERSAFSGGSGDQPVPIQDGVTGATSGNFDLLRQSPEQAFADLARAPVGFSRLDATMAACTCSGNWLA